MELIIYALLAAFIFSRLYHSLGRSTGRSTNINFSNLIDILEKNKAKVEEDDVGKYIDSADENMMNAYKEILKVDKNFSIVNFIQSSSIVFGMIIKYFNQGNLTQLKRFVDNDLYNSFAEKIANRNTITASEIVSIITQKITEIKIVKNVAFISVYFLSEQFNFSKNDKGEIIAGDTSTINKVEDVWQFKRTINASDPTWLLVSIKNNA
jgi:predicted lipid-binding transport protein (Tim44 family)